MNLHYEVRNDNGYEYCVTPCPLGKKTMNIASLIRRIAQQEFKNSDLSRRISLVSVNKKIRVYHGANEAVTRYLFVIDGKATEVLQHSHGFTWKNVNRLTMHQILRDIMSKI